MLVIRTDTKYSLFKGNHVYISFCLTILAFSPSWHMSYYINYRTNKSRSLYVQLQTYHVTSCVKTCKWPIKKFSHLDVLSITMPNIWIVGNTG